MAERLRNVREELRVYEYDAEQLYKTAPISRIPFELEEPSPMVPEPMAPQMSPRLPQPPSYVSLHRSTSLKRPDQEEVLSRARADTIPLSPLRRKDVSWNTDLRGMREGDPPSTCDRRRLDKIRQLTGSDDAVGFISAVNSPWYLKSRYSEQLKYDNDGQVRSGTVVALVEKLTADTSKDAIKAAKDMHFRNVFLMTFRTFMTADQLFDMLVDIYGMEHPKDISEPEFDDWKEKCWLPTQRTVMTVFTMWLEDHRLLEEEPHIAQKLTDFLNLIPQRNVMATTATLIMQSIKRLTFSSPCIESPIGSTRRRRRRSKDPKGDLLRLDPTDLAEQLCLYEYRLYNKITPQECLASNKSRSDDSRPGDVRSNLSSFSSTHDKLANWVTYSILIHEALGKRADTIDFWIKVADKSRALNNYASMSSVITALASAVIERLHLTWAHVGRKTHLDALLKYNDPTGGFSAYRRWQESVSTSCVPFVGMYLTDIVHIQDKFDSDDEQAGWISFIKRRQWYDVVTTMLHHQQKPYDIGESGSTQKFIANHLRTMGMKDRSWFWARSEEVRHSEFAHADIRRGLEAAGF
ncbi:ras GEF [Hymenopellis radicata]|nr:ras GEF [Hymenopellis radicata]